MKRGFIAAPLLGTIIFLASIVFIVNLNKAEAGETQLVASDAYHNRIVSLLEVYRTDLGSQFRENLSRVIEDFLASECWDNLFNIYNQKGNQAVDLEAVRKEKCEHVTTVIHQVICSFSSADCVGGEGGGGTVDCQRYGLPEWMAKIATNFTFEGVKFWPSNLEEFSVFLDSSKNPQLYQQKCETLLQGSIFDCEAFSQGEFKCRDPDTHEVVPGCERGTFYVKVKVLDPDIYPNLPRIMSDDGTGNQIRSGAISDADFYLPINYPLFKYYDYAFGAFSHLAYGEDGTKQPGGGGTEQDGVAEGFCGRQQGGDCRLMDEGFSHAGFSAESAESARDSFYDNSFKAACENASSSETAMDKAGITMKQSIAGKLDLSPENRNATIQLEACKGSCSTSLGTGGWVNCTTSSKTDFQPQSSFSIGSKNCKQGDGEEAQCEYIDTYSGSAARMRFIDYDHDLQANPNHLNEFCWRAEPSHEKTA